MARPKLRLGLGLGVVRVVEACVGSGRYSDGLFLVSVGLVVKFLCGSWCILDGVREGNVIADCSRVAHCHFPAVLIKVFDCISLRDIPCAPSRWVLAFSPGFLNFSSDAPKYRTLAGACVCFLKSVRKGHFRNLWVRGG